MNLDAKPKHQEKSFENLQVEKSINQHWQTLQFDTNRLGGLQQQLREQLVTSPCPVVENNLSQSATSVVESILSGKGNEALAKQLNALYEQQYSVYTQANIPKRLRTRQYICASGLVISPDHCVTTMRDTLRVSSFICGIDRGIRDLRKRFSGQLHIVYPACGPFAPLLLPLLSYYKAQGIYSPDDITVTLIDIQEGAVIALKSLIEALGLERYIQDIVHNDASSYQPNRSIHMVVLEAMQHGFSREGHLVLAKHFGQLLERKGVFIPQEVSVRASLNVAQKEFVDQWQTQDKAVHSDIRKERTELGEILSVNLNFLRNMVTNKVDEHTHLVQCGTVAIPHMTQNPDKQTLMINTRVNTFGDHWLDEYESGITQPLPDLQVCVNFTPKDAQPGDLLLNSGDEITFYYCLNGLPGFLATKACDAQVLSGDCNAK